MKIAFFVGRFPALSETFILNQITSLIERGYDVDIYANSAREQKKQHPDVQKYNLLDRTYYVGMPYNPLRRGMKGLLLLFANFHKNPAALLRSLNIFKYGRHAASLELLYWVIPLLPQRQYDIIHCHFGHNALRTVLLRDMGVLQGKAIATFHGFDITQKIQQFGEHYYDRLFKLADLFLPISHYWQQQLVNLGCNECQISVHHMGIDCRKFSFKQRQLPDNGCIRMVTIARLVEKKGVEYGIRAVVKLAEIHPDIEYTILGDGPLKEQLQQLIQQLNGGDKVKLLGWQQQDEVIEQLNRAHILLAPSVTSQDGDQEGIPVSLMEAMAMGLPVISTYHSGIPELIENGVSGFLVPEREVDALVEKLRELIEYPDVYTRIAEAGRIRVEEEFNIDTLSDRLLEIYHQLILNPSLCDNNVKPFKVKFWNFKNVTT